MKEEAISDSEKRQPSKFKSPTKNGRSLSPFEMVHKEKMIFLKKVLEEQKIAGGTIETEELPPHFSWRWNSKERVNHYGKKKK
mmetsp:Transcript_17768/g.27488  ORF Transcript_17768/g.27488 Transcript_17768/m.27488 type:complete len:83 (-) Transcript_17768:1458-1706(-)